MRDDGAALVRNTACSGDWRRTRLYRDADGQYRVLRDTPPDAPGDMPALLPLHHENTDLIPAAWRGW